MIASSGSNTTKKDHSDNLSLVGDEFDTVIKAKAAVDAISSCRKKGSCADILAIDTRDVVALSGGPSYTMELGRLDGLVSLSSNVNGKLPKPGFNLNQLNSLFANNGLTQTDMIALSGNNTIQCLYKHKETRETYPESFGIVDETCTNKVMETLKILSYNVWFIEDLEMHKRMKSLGDLIQIHSPDFICLQEVTPNIYDIFQQSGWYLNKSLCSACTIVQTNFLQYLDSRHYFC